MKTNTKTVLIIVATLVIGILIGALGTGFMAHRFGRRLPHMEHGEMFVEGMLDLIDPAPEQEDQIRGILTRHAQQFTEITGDFREEISVLVDSLRAELDSVLTEEQKERLDERHRRLGRLMKCGGPFPHGKPGDRRPPPPPPPPPEGGE
jgi:Spy/CpxP family protein refolding chaperone